jgi:hypothetical protein
LNDNGDYYVFTLLTCYQVFQAKGDPRAGLVLEAACRVLLEQTARISDEGMCRTFLGNIPKHREIVARQVTEPTCFSF